MLGLRPGSLCVTAEWGERWSAGPGGRRLDGALVQSAGDRWWRVWACPDHLGGLTRLREFGRRR